VTSLTASRLSEQLLEVRVPYECSSGKIEANFLLLSDIHLDNPKCDRKLLISHLEKCKEMGGSVLMFGDVLCLMQGKKDRRGSKGSIRPEHMGDNYFDLVFRESAEFLRPYASMILMMGDGNHETAVINNQEVNPLDNVARLMKEDGSKVEHMNYQGFVRFVFSKNGGSVRRCTLFFHHGTWGGIITKGVMGGGRYAQIAPDADVIVNGHNHERSIVSHPCYRVADNGNVWIEQRWHVQCGTYKNEFGSGAGWAAEKIVMPKSLGGIWMRLRPRKSGGVEISLMPAC
jgi:predicted phosphodiesterase